MAKASQTIKTVKITPKGTIKCPLCGTGNVPREWYTKSKGKSKK